MFHISEHLELRDPAFILAAQSNGELPAEKVDMVCCNHIATIMCHAGPEVLYRPHNLTVIRPNQVWAMRIT